MASPTGFQVAVELAEVGVRMMRQRLRRLDPAASEQEIDARLTSWLHDRPLDAPGVLRGPQQG